MKAIAKDHENIAHGQKFQFHSCTIFAIPFFVFQGIKPIAVSYSSLFFYYANFKFRLQIIFDKKFQFHSCSMCATPCFVCHGGKTSSHVASGTKTFWAPVLCQCTGKRGQIFFEVPSDFFILSFSSYVPIVFNTYCLINFTNC